MFFDEQKIEEKRYEGLDCFEYLDTKEIEKENTFVEFLVSQNGEPIQEVILFEGGYIGRKVHAAVCISDDTVLSGLHCKLVQDEDYLYIVDNNSQNG